jgi:putative ABC transport system permease protein
MSPALSDSRLFARLLRSNAGPLLALACCVLALSTLAAALPLALRAMTVAEAAHELAALPAADRSVVAVATGGPTLGPDRSFDGFLAELDGIAASAPAPLRDALGAARFAAESESLPLSGDTGTASDLSTFLRLGVAPGLGDRVRMTAGSAPGPFASVDDTVEIVLPEAGAGALDWAVGEERVAGVDDGAFRVRLAGTFSPLDPADDYWVVSPDSFDAVTAEAFHLGTRTRLATVEGFIDPASLWAVNHDRGLSMTTRVAFPLSTAQLSSDGLSALPEQLRRFEARPFSVGEHHSADVAWQFAFSSGSGAAVEAAVGRVATAGAVLATIASGPIGVAVAVLWLLATLLVERRRATLVLLAARGAGPVRLRAWLAAEGLVAALPAAAAGAGLAVAAFSALAAETSPVPALAPAASVAVAAAALLVLAATERRIANRREDLGTRRPGRARWMLDVVAIGLAAASVALLLVRGSATSTAIGFDPLAAAAPLLLAVAVALVVLRLYPLPLAALGGAVRSGRGVVSFLGAARAVRESAAGVAIVVALVLGLSVSVFSSVVLGTVRTGISESSLSTGGAPLRLDAEPPGCPAFDDALLGELGGLPGVGSVAGILRYEGQKQLIDRGEPTDAVVLVADTAALARVQAGVPGAPVPDGDLSVRRDGAIPVLLSHRLAGSGDHSFTFSGSALIANGTPGTGTTLAHAGDWIIVDTAFADELGLGVFRPQTVLLSPAPDADAATLEADILRVAGVASITTPATARADVLSSPVVSGFQALLAALIATMALACAAVCVLTLLVAAPRRRRLLTLLTALGLTSRQSRGITAWELAPPVLVGVLAGGGLGLALPFLVLAGADLRPVTGGAEPPRISVDPILLSGILCGFLVIVALATVIVMVTARRRGIAAAVRSPMEG